VSRSVALDFFLVLCGLTQHMPELFYRKVLAPLKRTELQAVQRREDSNVQILKLLATRNTNW